MHDLDVMLLFDTIENNYSFHNRINKLAEECAEYLEAYFHYTSRGEGYLDKLVEEIAGIDFVMLTLKKKILKIPKYNEMYKEIFSNQLKKAEEKVTEELNGR